MKLRAVKSFAPASISNLGPGFDVLGLAIDKPGDYVRAERMDASGLSFSLQPGTNGAPAEPSRNVAAHVASLILDEVRPGFGVQMVLDKRMPIGSGLGSSAASSAAAAAAVNALLPRPMRKLDLLRFVVEGERVACGSPHADNAAPSLLGGVWLIRSYDPLDVLPIRVRNSIAWVVVHPNIIVETKKAREILPAFVPLAAATRQIGNVSGLTAGLIAGDAALVGKCVEDVIVEPIRAQLIPGYDAVKRAALAAGATGCSISGSGPSVFAVTPSRPFANRVARAMVDAFEQSANVPSKAYISRVNMDGATVVASR